MRVRIKPYNSAIVFSNCKFFLNHEGTKIEFSIISDQRQTPFEITIDYFACDDNDTFCIPVRQVFEVTLEADRDGGRVMRRPGDAQASRFSRARNPGFLPSWFLQFDTNHDRSIDYEELEQAPALIGALDTNQDGVVSRTEFRAWMMARPD